VDTAPRFLKVKALHDGGTQRNVDQIDKRIQLLLHISRSQRGLVLVKLFIEEINPKPF
jgi:hypothetical protein